MRTRYLDLDDRNEDLREMLRERGDAGREFLEKFELSWIYHENALEGIVLSSEELQGALQDRPVEDASLVNVFTEIRNHRTAIHLVREEARRRSKYSLGFLRRLHDIIAGGLPLRPGTPLYRADMPLHRTYFHDIERPEKIAPALQRLVDYMNGNEFRAHHPIKQASVAHWKFMQIFPFTNHTGTVGRLMLSLILIRHGYLPLVIHAIDRQRYYESLRHPEPTLRALVMECMHNSIENGFKFFRPIEEPRESTAG